MRAYLLRLKAAILGQRVTAEVCVNIYSLKMQDVPDPSYFLAMPTIRSRPEWFINLHPGLAQVILKHLKRLRPAPQPLRAFPMSGRDLDSDGIHLNAVSGIPYVQFLVDQPR